MSRRLTFTHGKSTSTAAPAVVIDSRAFSSPFSTLIVPFVRSSSPFLISSYGPSVEHETNLLFCSPHGTIGLSTCFLNANRLFSLLLRNNIAICNTLGAYYMFEISQLFLFVLSFN